MTRLLLLLAFSSLASADEVCTYFSPTTGTCPSISFTSQVSILNYNGVAYTGPGFTGSYVNVPFVADDGTMVTVSAVLTSSRKLVNNGRAHYYRYSWLLSGLVVE